MKHYLLALLIVVASSGLVPVSATAAALPPSPDPTHPRITQQEAAALAASTYRAPAGIGGAAPQAIIAGAFGPSREVFGFGLASSLADPTFGYPTWDFGVLTTVAFFGLHVQDDGTFAADAAWTTWNSSQLTGLVTMAHAKGTKVVLTIILQDFGAGTPHMCAGLAHYTTTIARTVAEVKAKGVDGVNVDYEGLNGSCGTADPSWARNAFTYFMSQLRPNLPGAFLTVDTYASSATDPLGFFDVAGLNANVDAFFVMAYDLEYSNYSRPPTNCASFCLGPTSPLGGYYYNDNNTVSQYVSTVPASKVILGVPYYGRVACVGTPGPNAVPTGPVSAAMYLDASTETTSPDIRPGSYVTHRDLNDPSGEVRWDTWFNTAMNCTRELYWDDTVSLGHKYDLVNSSNLRGVGMWTLNYGGGARELWQLLSLKFASTTAWSSLNGVLTSGPGASSWGAARTDVFAVGSDRGLWQNVWNGTAWGGWSPLGGIVTGDPGAVSWSAGRIDVFVRGQDGALYHRYSDGARWWGWEGLGGGMQYGPKVASMSPQRLDIFITGNDSQLWHKYWNGGWSGWEPLGGVLTSAPAVVSWAANRLDIFARGGDNQMWHMDWHGNGWSGWTPMGGSFASGPAAASCAAGRLDVYAVGTDQGMWRNGWNGTAWSGWQRQGGYWLSDPGAVCPTGTTTVSVFDRGPDGAIWRTNVPGA
jgi:spore germination protein YaaH